MKKIVLGVAAFLLIAAPVFASDARSEFSENNANVPQGSKLVINTNYKVERDEDSGNVGYWALDNYTKHVQVWQTPDSKYYTVARYVGKWKTFKGAKSPGAGVTQQEDATGSMRGGYTATFAAPSCTPVFGKLEDKDFGGTKADIMLGTYGAGQVGPVAPYSFLSAYCPGYTDFNYEKWGWTYRYENQVWDNSSAGTSGDIIVTE